MLALGGSTLRVVNWLDEAREESRKQLVAVVPARAGSKGLAGKNLRVVGGRPLFQHAIASGRDAGADLIVVTTDIPEILDADHGPAVLVHERPNELCGDHVPMSDVLLDVATLPELAESVVLLLQPTSPLRRTSDIVRAIEVFRSRGCDMVLSVTKVSSEMLKCGTIVDGRFYALRTTDDVFSNRQSLPPVYEPDGAIFVFEADWLRRAGGLHPATIGALIIDQGTSVDIDDEFDLERVEQEFRERERSEA